MSARLDVIVIGAGPGGEVCAGALAEAGLRVAVVERELVAGECSYWACMPTKTLLRPGEALAAARRVPGAREAVHGEVDVAEALAFRDWMTAGWDDAGQVGWLDREGIELIRGTGSIAGPGLVAVDGVLHQAEHIVLATGSTPIVPPVPGLRDLPGLWTNREIAAMREVPRRLLILGGGAVGVEMAQAVARFGGEVALVEGAPHLLAREPAALGQALAEALEADGVELRLGEHAVGARLEGETYVLSFADGSDLRGDRLLVATGRAPRTAGIGLETVGVAPASRGVPVDERMRVTDGVWAVGDVTGLMQFTHVGKYQGRIAAADILGRPARADYRAVPRVVFTDPQVAAVGTTDGPSTGTGHMSEVPRAFTYERPLERPGFLTVVGDGDVLVGAYAVGPEAGEWLGQLTLAIRAGVPIDVLRDVIQPFPTFSEIVQKALDDLAGPVGSSPTAVETMAIGKLELIRRIVAVAALGAAALAVAGFARQAARPALPGLAATDARAIQGYQGWTRLLGRPRGDLAALGRAHPGTKRIYVDQTARRLAPDGRQRFPYPVGTTIVKTGRSGDAITLVAIMRKVALSGPRDGGWDFVEYQRPSGAASFARVGGGEAVCTGCHRIAQQRQRTDWTFDTLR